MSDTISPKQVAIKGAALAIAFVGTSVFVCVATVYAFDALYDWIERRGEKHQARRQAERDAKLHRESEDCSEEAAEEAAAKLASDNSTIAFFRGLVLRA